MAAELRQLEYAQRLRDRARNVMAVAGGSTGRALFDAALEGGAAALGTVSSGLVPGASADIVSLDPESPALVGRDGDALIDSWIFGGHRCVDSVWVRGVRHVAGGRHRNATEVLRQYQAAVQRLLQS
jgi:cytosine/adenosine deaminase-related metal-dependent hydrolase